MFLSIMFFVNLVLVHNVFNHKHVYKHVRVTAVEHYYKNMTTTE